MREKCLPDLELPECECRLEVGSFVVPYALLKAAGGELSPVDVTDKPGEYSGLSVRFVASSFRVSGSWITESET
jgi:hypothetical protein